MARAKRNAMQYSVISFQPIQEAIFLSIGMPLLFSRSFLSLCSQFCYLLFKGLFKH